MITFNDRGATVTCSCNATLLIEGARKGADLRAAIEAQGWTQARPGGMCAPQSRCVACSKRDAEKFFAGNAGMF